MQWSSGDESWEPEHYLAGCDEILGELHDRLDEGLSGEVDGTMAPGWLCFDDEDFKSAPGESMDIRATAVARAPAPRPPRAGARRMMSMAPGGSSSCGDFHSSERVRQYVVI